MVLTGGSSKMEGLVELAEEILHMPVRLGAPQRITGLGEVVRNPIYSTGVGLLLFGHRNTATRASDAVSEAGFKAVWDRMKSWFQGNF
jgi:cell division protein FtsA